MLARILLEKRYQLKQSVLEGLRDETHAAATARRFQLTCHVSPVKPVALEFIKVLK